MRILDDLGREVPTGEVGEVCGRGPLMMAGYYKRPDLTAGPLWAAGSTPAILATSDVMIRDDLPRNVAGKTLKRELQERYKAPKGWSGSGGGRRRPCRARPSGRKRSA